MSALQRELYLAVLEFVRSRDVTDGELAYLVRVALVLGGVPGALLR